MQVLYRMMNSFFFAYELLCTLFSKLSFIVIVVVSLACCKYVLIPFVRCGQMILHLSLSLLSGSYSHVHQLVALSKKKESEKSETS